jgi:uncharacterized protein involved in exopolysaccharide biosynthesis
LEENPDKTEYVDDDEINLIDYAKVVWKYKKLIIAIVVVVVVATAAISLLMTKVYESKAVIAPVAARTETGGMSAIAAQFGLASPASSNTSEIMNFLKSNILMDRIVKKHNLLSVLFKPDSLKIMTEDQKSWKGIRAMAGILKFKLDQKNNAIEISAQYKDPDIAADIVRYTIDELNELMSSEAIRVADTNKKYLESQIDKTLDPFIRTKIYSMVAQQIETSMMAEVKENFAFKVIDPPRVPDTRIKPKRTQMVMIAFVVSIFIGIFVAFGKEYIDKIRMKQSER